MCVAEKGQLVLSLCIHLELRESIKKFFLPWLYSKSEADCCFEGPSQKYSFSCFSPGVTQGVSHKEVRQWFVFQDLQPRPPVDCGDILVSDKLSGIYCKLGSLWAHSGDGR